MSQKLYHHAAARKAFLTTGALNERFLLTPYHAANLSSYNTCYFVSNGPLRNYVFHQRIPHI